MCVMLFAHNQAQYRHFCECNYTMRLVYGGRGRRGLRAYILAHGYCAKIYLMSTRVRKRHVHTQIAHNIVCERAHGQYIQTIKTPRRDIGIARSARTLARDVLGGACIARARH